MTPHRINMRMKDRPSRISAYDRRLAAIHEAGHVLMAIYLGYEADAWIHPHQSADMRNEKAWLGKMIIRNQPADLDNPHMRMVAVAGMVAERLWKNGHDDEYAEPYSWEDLLLDGDIMSFSDWRLAGSTPGDPDDGLYDIAAEVAELFMTDLWSTLTGISRSLMNEAGVIHNFKNVSEPPAQALAA